MKNNVLAVVLAGGKGERLEPLTRDRAKPAVPFGGEYRIVDFTLSNCFNSGVRQILLLTQYKSLSLDRHVASGWARFFHRELREFVDVAPPQQRLAESWYQGTADAVYQNIYSIEKESPELVLVLAGDHVYKMDYRDIIEFHRAKNADLTISALPVPLDEARGRLGVLAADADGRVVDFEEKPLAPRPLPDDPDSCFASMGVYVFNAKFLYEALCRDATKLGSRRDFGRDVVPRAVENDRVFAFPFVSTDADGKKRGAYWRDVGTLDAYFAANMDLVAVEPELNLYDENWTIYSPRPNTPPAKFILPDGEGRGCALDSLVCSGAIVSGGTARRSIVGFGARVERDATVEDSLLFARTVVERGARLRRTIVDKGAVVPAGWRVGFDPALDRSRGFFVTESGVTVIPKFVG